jgi:probable phosphoglycerate mutase
MTAVADRYLYLARHAEATADESGLTESGRRQATLLGDRLRASPVSVIHHGPLPRAQETAELVHGRLDGVDLRMSKAAGDYIPYMPEPGEITAESGAATVARLAEFPAEERELGPALAQEALDRFTGPVEGGEPRHELVVTHNFLVGWIVRAALDAPNWRWVSLNHANAALTVIRYAPGRPASVLLYNDTGHLPATLRWTGFPPELRV